MHSQAEKSEYRYLFDKRTHFRYLALMKTLNSTLKYESSDPAQFRFHVIKYAEEYGLKATLSAFNLKKSTFYCWRKKYLGSDKKLVSLVPRSTRPVTLRKMEVDWQLIDFIKETRKKYGNVGAKIIKPFLDIYANQIGVKPIARTTIEKVIRRRKLTFEVTRRSQRKTVFQKLRTRKSPKVTIPGYIEVDTIEIRVFSHTYYFVSIIDIFTRYAYVELLPHKSSSCTRDSLIRFKEHYHYPVHSIQTDNGSEFFKSFHEYLEEQEIKHIFTYPNSPKLNGVVERFNRTIQEEFINRSKDFGVNQDDFLSKLINYLTWYNYKRPHSSLGYQSPMQFIQARV